MRRRSALAIGSASGMLASIMHNPDKSRPIVRFKPGHHRRFRNGHPWGYSNEVAPAAATDPVAAGSIVDVENADGQPLGTALFNPYPLITLRRIDRRSGVVIDRGYLAERVRAALTLRERLFHRPYYRLIHAEADGLPGTVADRFDDVIVLELNCAGMDRLAEPLVEALAEVTGCRAIVLRNDNPVREIEQLPREARVALGSLDTSVHSEEDGARFPIDAIGGQKTGWFYDQRDNRAFIAGLSAGGDVLDMYCHLGGFGIRCAMAGARSVLAVDRAATALDQARQAAELNGVADRFETLKGEAFSTLAHLTGQRQQFDVVVVDPPAFVKVRKDLKPGLRGYRKLVKLAAPLVRPGGFLMAASCSHHVSPEAFAEQVRLGLADARRLGRVLRRAGAAPDHPIDPFLPESAYLKAETLQLD